MAYVYVGLGSNMGDREGNIAAARKGLAALRATHLLRNAPVYETRPVGGPADQGDFYNSVSLLETTLSPLELLDEIQALEKALGRDRAREVRWGPRTMDIDILLWNDEVVEEGERLLIPHPRMAKRGFVLCPLADLDPDYLHPVLDLTVSELLERMDLADEGIRRISL